MAFYFPSLLNPGFWSVDTVKQPLGCQLGRRTSAEETRHRASFTSVRWFRVPLLYPPLFFPPDFLFWMYLRNHLGNGRFTFSGLAVVGMFCERVKKLWEAPGF